MSRRVLRALVAALCGVVLMAMPRGASAADAVRLGDVAVVRPDGQGGSLDEGEHDTAFTLELPRGATCPGDSANDDWRLQSFVVPASDDPATLTYMVTGPDGPDPQHDARVALYTTEGRPFVHQLLGANVEAGQPGDILALPPLSFARLPVDYLPSGPYRVGLACTHFGATAQYWDTEITITASATAMRWSLIGERSATSGGTTSAAGTDGGTNLVPIVAGVAVLTLAVASALVVRRRARTNPPLVKENR